MCSTFSNLNNESKKVTLKGTYTQNKESETATNVLKTMYLNCFRTVLLLISYLQVLLLSTCFTPDCIFYLCPNVLPLSIVSTPVQMFYLYPDIHGVYMPCLQIIALPACSTSVSCVLTPHTLSLLTHSTSVFRYTSVIMFYPCPHVLPLSTSV